MERGGRQKLPLGAGPRQPCLLGQLGEGNQKNRMATESPSKSWAQRQQATGSLSGEVTSVYCHTPGLSYMDIFVNDIKMFSV